jgi:O-antigen/teichoic acid export membrane protein
MSFKGKVIRGLSWSFAGRFGSQFCQLVISIVLARLLTPSEFGVIGMLLVFTGFAQTFVDGGLSSALIYHRDIAEAHRSSAFWLQLGIGAALSAAFYLLAPAIAWFYGVPQIAGLARLLSLVFVVQALSLTQTALLSREFKFRALGIATLVATLISGLAAVVMAQMNYGVWALAWQPLLNAALLAALLWFQSDWRPRFVFDRTVAGELGRYGLYLTGHMTLNYWLRNGDNLLIGKVLGAHPLGIYARAYSLMLLPLTNIGAVFGQVMFPALSQLQDDMARFKRHYLTATRTIALVAFPLMAGVAVLSKPLILFLLGPKWIEVVPILQILSIVGLVQSIIFPVGWVFTALGRTRDQFRLSLLLTAAFAVAMAAGIRYGLLGVTYAYAVWTLLSGFLNLRLIGRYIHLPVRENLLSVAPIAALSAVMGLAVYGLDSTAGQAWPLIVRLLAGGTLGVLSFGALCAATRNHTFLEVWQLAHRGLGTAFRARRA